jgi:hypothetical protein
MRCRDRERGSALMLCIIVTLILVGMSAAYLSISLASGKKTNDDVAGQQAFYSAEAGAALHIHEMNAGARQNPPVVPPPMSGPAGISGGTYFVPPQVPLGTKKVQNPLYYGQNGVDDDGDGVPDDDDEKNFVRLEVQGTHAGITRRLEIILTHTAGGVYWNAVFAGNKSGDPYNLMFGGPAANTGLPADVVWGDIYSGGSFQSTGGAQMVGESGLPGSQNTVMSALPVDPLNSNPGPEYKTGSQASLDMPRNSQDQSFWEQKALALRSVGGLDPLDGVRYIDVANELATKGASGTNYNNGFALDDVDDQVSPSMGKAQQQITNRNEPAHIFRKDPTKGNSTTTDRTVGYGFTNTAKPDYYLEDPTHLNGTGVNDRPLPRSVNGDDRASGIYLSPTGNNAVYFVDGNVWASHENLKNFQLVRSNATEPAKVTFVVKGNLNFTDNFMYHQLQSQVDAVAFIAIEDAGFPNKRAADFSNPGNVLRGNMTVADFVNQFNGWARSAGTDRVTGLRKMPDLDLANLDLARAAQEYNRAYGSGNVFYGDPGSGTVDYFEGFMYAENNFYATGLDAGQTSGGTAQVEIFGNMTAGNQVNILRNTREGWKPLEVRFDNKIKTGRAVPPALPKTPGYGDGEWFIASWKQIP